MRSGPMSRGVYQSRLRADRQFADAIEEALVRAEKVELLKEVNRDLRDRLTDLEAAAWSRAAAGFCLTAAPGAGSMGSRLA
jgi:hypothetical protein